MPWISSITRFPSQESPLSSFFLWWESTKEVRSSDDCMFKISVWGFIVQGFCVNFQPNIFSTFSDGYLLTYFALLQVVVLWYRNIDNIGGLKRSSIVGNIYAGSTHLFSLKSFPYAAGLKYPLEMSPFMSRCLRMPHVLSSRCTTRFKWSLQILKTETVGVIFIPFCKSFLFCLF